MADAPLSSPPQRIVSQMLLQDSDLRDLVEEFVAALPRRLDEIRRAFEQLDWTQLAMLTHRLKGAGGSYGYPQLSRLAAEMEQGFLTRQAERFADWARQFEQLVAAFSAGLQPT
jgi:HPt (histidine-containing phosphotransfer) domain-containing protein